MTFVLHYCRCAALMMIPLFSYKQNSHLGLVSSVICIFGVPSSFQSFFLLWFCCWDSPVQYAPNGKDGLPSRVLNNLDVDTDRETNWTPRLVMSFSFLFFTVSIFFQLLRSFLVAWHQVLISIQAQIHLQRFSYSKRRILVPLSRTFIWNISFLKKKRNSYPDFFISYSWFDSSILVGAELECVELDFSIRLSICVYLFVDPL